ncbi:MAG: hypothetical protein VX738_16710 [Planctomycetota bacterium]|nr:hypothetical protein [Planctomycetota bacterium]
MLNLLLLLICVSILLAIPLLGIAMLCHIRISPDAPEQTISRSRLFGGCCLLTLLYHIVAYQGYGGYMLIALIPLSMYILKLTWIRATLFSITAWLVLVCATLLISFLIIFSGLKQLSYLEALT